MRYHELIELYKKKELSEQERQRVEQDIERHEAISEYLFEREEQETLEFGFDREESAQGEKDEHTDQKSDQKADEFTRRVNRAIRQAFIKMGAAVCAVTLVIVLLILFVLPETVSMFYYDPGRIVGENEYGGTTNQMSLDMAVYTELMVPGEYRYNVQVDDRGYGDYDITIYQNVSFTGTFTNVAGRIERDNLQLYDVNQLRRPTGNIFGWFQMEPKDGKTLTELAESGNGSSAYFFSAAGDRKQATETLNSLDENGLYYGYVTLDRLMPYEEYMTFMDEIINNDDLTVSYIWCAPITWREPAARETDDIERLRLSNLGFYIDSGSGPDVDWDREKYPDLVLWASGDESGSRRDERAEQIKDEDKAAEHFAIMLDYMAEQEAFLEMMPDAETPEKLSEAADYVRENGLTVYGFGCMADKETLLKINEMEGVYSIAADEMK